MTYAAIVWFTACEGTVVLSEDPAQSSIDDPVVAADDSTSSQFGQYVLHPPLPAVVDSATTSSDQLSAIPLLLNPDILHSSKIPVITPQTTKVQATNSSSLQSCQSFR